MEVVVHTGREREEGKQSSFDVARPKLELVMDSSSNYSNKQQHLGLLTLSETEARIVSRYFSSSTRP